MKYPTADSDYYRKYGLAKDPFPVNTVDNVMFITHEHNQILDLIREQITNSQLLQVIMSPPGGGKTFLSHHLDAVKEPDWKISLVKANTGMGINNLADAFVQQIFSDETVNPDRAVSQLHKYLELTAHKELTPVLIIDDAHKLPLETLEFILQLAELKYGESFFRIVLFANNDINDLLDDPKLIDMTEKLIHKTHIAPLTKEQTRIYINNRLSLSGVEDKSIFTDGEITQIFEDSGGLPKEINLQARTILQDSAKSKPSSNIFSLNTAVFGVIVILTVSAYTLIFNKQNSEELTDTAISMRLPETQPTSPADHQLPKQAIAQVQSSESETPVSQVQPIVQMEEESELEMEAQMSGDDLLTLETPDASIEDGVVESETVYVFEDSLDEAIVATEVPVESDEMVKSEVVPMMAESFDEVVPIEEPAVSNEMVESETVYVVDDSFEEATVVTEVPVDSDEVVESETISGMSESVEEVQAAIEELPEMQEEIKPPVTEQQESGSICNEVNIYHLDEIPDFIACVKGPDWFHKQPSRSYALQLTSSRDVVSVEKLLRGQAVNQDQLSGYTNYTPSGKPRYLLYYGIYPDKAAAKAAAQTLPEKLRAVGPWPRSTRDIVTELNNLAARGY